MEYPIQFRYMANKLTPMELKSFFSSLIDSNKTNFLLTCVFNQLLIESKTDIHNSNECVTAIANILNKRKSIINNKNDQNDINDNVSIEHLPSTMINNIASYLRLSDLVKMERVNRKFFTSLRIPYPALQCIGVKKNTLRWISKYIQKYNNTTIKPDFRQFMSVKKILLYHTDCELMADKYSWDQIAFNKVNDVTIWGSYTRFDDLFKWNIINFNMIKHLIIGNMTFNDHQSFKNLILCSKYSKSIAFVNIKCQSNTTIFASLMSNQNEIRSKLSHLKAFDVYNTDLKIYKNVLNAVSEQIESLHIDDENALKSEISFKNIREFCMVGSRIQITVAINELLKTAKCLQKVYFDIDDENEQKLNKIDKANYCCALKNILSLPCLECIVLRVISKEAVKPTMDILESSTMIKREKLKVEITIPIDIDQAILRLVTNLGMFVSKKRFEIVIHQSIKDDTKVILKQIVDIINHSNKTIILPPTINNKFHDRLDFSWNKCACRHQ